MKQKIVAIFIVLLFIGILSSDAQKLLKQVIVLQMPEGGGANSASVAWNPVTKKYYSCMAGNATYPMGVFDEKGKIMLQDVVADYDFRGIWYNPISKQLQFNTYDSAGVGHIELEKDGTVKNKAIDFEGMNQPDGQSVGFYYPPSNNILYLSLEHSLEKYDQKSLKKLGTLCNLYAGCKTKKQSDALTEDESITRWGDRNLSVQYTGVSKGEFAVLNVTKSSIELYDKTTGFLTNIAYSIPASLKLELNFNFSYANGLYWFFQKDKRQWVGCK